MEQQIRNVFHGTNTTFTKFNCPAYFTDDYDTALFFANGGRYYESDKPEQSLHQGAVLTCTLILHNPLIVNLDGQSWGGFHLEDEEMERDCIEFVANSDDDEKEYFAEEGLTTNFFVEYAAHLGYDGVVFYNCYEENGRIATQYVVFSPENIIIHKNQEVSEYEL